MSWVEKITVVPRPASPETNSQRRARWRGSRPTLGSSSSSTPGRESSPIAMLIRCWLPPESRATISPRRSPRPVSSSISAAEARGSSCPSSRANSRRFSSTVSRLYRAACCGTQPTAPSAASTSPASAFEIPARIESNVVFPAPFGPMTATSSPGPASRETPRRASLSPNRLTTPVARTREAYCGPPLNSRAMPFPSTRLRRLRRTDTLRGLVRETELSPAHLIQPAFVVAGEGVREEVPSMPGIERFSINNLVEEAGAIAAAGIGALMLFGVPAAKDEFGTGAYDDEGIVQMAVRALKEAHPDLVVITDVCLCEYTSHGHCGIIREGSTEVDNDLSVELLAKTAISHAEAGADAVAPSDMMDGRVGSIRHQLDEEGHPDTPIVAYSAKYASAFYGPFRDAAGSTPEFGDRRGYQMDPANAAEAVREAELDLDEGADMLMVKPALPYLDVVRRVKEATGAPLAAYHVSGEYSMLKAAAANGWLDERAAALEALTSIRRAGADAIVTYYAKEAAGWLQ